MSPRRDLTLAAAALIVMVSLLPAFGRVFADTGWRAPALLAAVLAVGLAAGARRVRGGALLATLVTVAGLAFFTHVAHLTPDGLLPGAEQVRQTRGLVAEALGQMRAEPAPVPSFEGLVLLVTTGFWAVGHLVHELLVRWGRPAMALVPAIALWTVPLAVPQPDSAAWPVALAFLAAAGVVLLLGSDAETASGDHVPTTPGAGVGIGVTALLLALLAPGALPGYGADAWVELRGGGAPHGYQPIVDVTQRLQVPEERDVLRVLSEERTYLRLAGLDAFDGGTWRLGEPGDRSYQPEPQHLHSPRGTLPPEAQAAVTTPVTAEIEVLALENIYVPVPYQPVRITGPDRDEMVWSTDGGFLATWATGSGEDAASGEGQPRVGVRQGFTYEVTAERPTPDSLEALRADEAAGDEHERLTRLPHDYDALREQAEAVYAEAGAEHDVDRAFALQEWFADGPFTYDLDVPALRDEDALTDFVLEQRVGYCEYFATAMAVMLRATDVPARVAVGFLSGRVTEEADPEAGRGESEFTVSTADAHAWVEVYFPEHGWVAFEPTPRDDDSQIVPRPDELAPTETERERIQRERDETGGEVGDLEPIPELSDDVAVPPDPSAPGDEGGGLLSPQRRLPLAGVIGLALLAATLVLTAMGRRRTRPLADDPAGRVLVAQRGLLDVARRHGVARRPAETLREVVDRWTAEGRIDDRGTRFSALATAAAFGADVDEPRARQAERLADDLSGLLRTSVPASARLLAPVRVPLEHAGAAVDRLRARLGRGPERA